MIRHCNNSLNDLPSEAVFSTSSTNTTKETLILALSSLNLTKLVPNCSGAQLNKVEKFNSWTLTTSTPDNCVYLNDLTIVQICNFVKHGETNVIIGRRYERKFDFYGPPVCSTPSSYIYEFKVFQSDLSTRLYAWDIHEIKCKADRLPEPYPNTTYSFVVFPLLMQ